MTARSPGRRRRGARRRLHSKGISRPEARDKFSHLSHLYKEAVPGHLRPLIYGMTTITEFRVRYAETDQMGVVYHANYLVWCEIGRTDFIRELGTPYADLERENVALAVVEASLRFHGAARYDDLVRVRTSLREVRSRMITFDYLIENAATGARLISA